jgi:hypothetical protein
MMRKSPAAAAFSGVTSAVNELIPGLYRAVG